MNHRLLAAGLLGGAALVVFLGVWPVMGWDVALYGAFSAVPVAALVGALAAPRLASDARAGGSGVLAGIAVTAATCVLSALALGLFLHLADSTPAAFASTANAVQFLRNGLEFTLILLTFGLLFLLPACVPGGLAGWWFYRLVRAEPG